MERINLKTLHLLLCEYSPYEILNKESCINLFDSIFSRKIPKDIVSKIVDDYFKYDIEYNSLLNILENNNSKKLNGCDLLYYIDNVLNDPLYIKYIQSKNSLFKEIYQEHYVQNNKTFILMNVKESLCCSWLMNLYH